MGQNNFCKFLNNFNKFLLKLFIIFYVKPRGCSKGTFPVIALRCYEVPFFYKKEEVRKEPFQ